jgi:hypothetical protein
LETIPIRERILKKRGPLCEYCRVMPWQELHHCLVHDSKRYHTAVTVPENLMAVCRSCHPLCNGHEVRITFAQNQLKRGYDIGKWYRSLGLKSPEYWLLSL